MPADDYDADDERRAKLLRRDREKKQRRRQEMSDAAKEAERSKKRKRMQALRQSLSDAAKEQARKKNRERMAAPAAKEATRKRMTAPAAKEATRKRKAAPAAKEATRKRMAAPAAKEADRKRLAAPAAKEATRKRMAEPKALAAHRAYLAGVRSREVRDELGNRRACPYCGALMWQCAGLTCCNDGRHVARRLSQPPRELLRWEGAAHANPWTCALPQKSTPWEARPEVPEHKGLAGLYTERGFSAASRRLNNHFAFSAIGTDVGKKRSGAANDDNEDKAGPAGFGFVRLAGRVYHYVPSADDDRSNVGYYVNDMLPSVPKASDTPWMRTIHAVLMREHPLAKQLRATREVRAREVRVVLDPDLPKPHCGTEISARYRITTDVDDMPHRSFVAFNRDGGEQWYPTLNHELYEALQYALLHSRGTLGWWARKNHQMYTDINGNPMTLMWYARQRLCCERTFHACGRLLNEWMVDMFCRIDDNRLNYLSSPEGQKKLRIAEKADLEHYCEDIGAGMGAEADKPGRILL
eukprot:gene3402-162_t